MTMLRRLGLIEQVEEYSTEVIGRRPHFFSVMHNESVAPRSVL